MRLVINVVASDSFMVHTKLSFSETRKWRAFLSYMSLIPSNILWIRWFRQISRVSGNCLLSIRESNRRDLFNRMMSFNAWCKPAISFSWSSVQSGCSLNNSNLFMHTANGVCNSWAAFSTKCLCLLYSLSLWLTLSWTVSFNILNSSMGVGLFNGGLYLPTWKLFSQLNSLYKGLKLLLNPRWITNKMQLINAIYKTAMLQIIVSIISSCSKVDNSSVSS